jgi:RecQ family ATP-dependent DNA helicase
MSDEFGDDDFLADFDVDAVVQKRQALSPPATMANSKRMKRSPLGSLPLNSRITSGSRVNPTKELASFNPYSTTESASNNEAEQESSVIVKPLLTKALQETLQKYFGYDDFRTGQLEVIQAALDHRDVGVFWATGSGKSLCYQIPALHTGHVAIVVSPLISLMEDQVHKLNGLSDRPLATFLGSAQGDASMEDRALQGEFPLVYVTPEKLLAGNFLDRLAHLHTHKNRLSLIAIDESHCVSEWGHDFRPEYRKLHLLRAHSSLKDVPIMALTATAIPRVQNDILSSLRLASPHIARQSFDRENLIIAVQKKRGGMHATLSPLLPKLYDRSSTIVYAPTRDQVQELANFLQSKLASKKVVVEAYHAGMSPQQRTAAHTNFLVGKTHIICATVAFGMGIDKPDTRRVWHYGPPKTMEEYYQQIGRAGRDGLPAECIMVVNDGDFDRYRSDFYMGSLPAEAKLTVGASLDALRQFSLDGETCRRKGLLNFFQETPSFGERCGTCDTCQSRKKFAGDLERDMGKMGARVILMAVSALRDQGLSFMEKVISGNVIDSYRYKPGTNITLIKDYISQAKNEMERKRPLSYFRELLAPLVSKGYLVQNTKSVAVPGSQYSKAFTYYSITSKGTLALHDTSAPITLPVPQSLRDLEAEEEEKRQKKFDLLEKAGVDLKQIPKEELALGDGDVIRAFSKWHSYLDALYKGNKEDRIQQLEDLRLRIDAWRMDTADKFRVAPATVLAEHIVLRIAYTAASMKPGVKVDKEALVAAGVRSREIDSLVIRLSEWVDEVQPAVQTSDVSGGAQDGAGAMVFDDTPFQPKQQWEYAVYKSQKKTGLATWESSHQRFLQGEHPASIAMAPANGRPIQIGTVMLHILQGLELGRETPLKKLAQLSTAPPNSVEWDELVRVEALTGMSVVDDPNTSGVDGGKFTMTEFLRPIMGDAFIDTPFNERNDVDKAKFGKWCELLKWYMGLKRVGYEPKFSE